MNTELYANFPPSFAKYGTAIMKHARPKKLVTIRSVNENLYPYIVMIICMMNNRMLHAKGYAFAGCSSGI